LKRHSIHERTKLDVCIWSFARKVLLSLVLIGCV
jgi:hypothetical protein